MGVLPPWEVARQSPRSATQTRSLRCDRSSEPTQEPQRREDPQEEALSQPRTQTIVPDDCWSAVLNSGGEAASHNIFGDQSLSSADWEPPSHQSWEFPGAEPQHHSPQDGVTATVESFLGLDTPGPLREMAAHFDSPDPSPMEPTHMLSPFMFVARHYATNNSEFSGFHFAPDPGEAPAAAALPFADALVSTNPAGQYQQDPIGRKTSPENLLESFAWTTGQIDGIVRNMQSGPLFDLQ